MKRFIAKCIVKLSNKRRQLYDRIHLTWLRGEFKHLGAHAIIETPIRIMNPQCISIGDHFTAREGVKLRAYTAYDNDSFTPEISIGNHVHFAADVTINCFVKLVIGDHTGIGAGSKVMDHMHGLPTYEDLHIPVMERVISSKGGVIIGKNVLCGAGVMILAGVEIGDNAVIGSNSVVTRSIPANCIAAGVPARIIRQITPQ